MQYQVPQFLEIEDKIFGPLTFRQFLYVAGGAALGFISYTTMPFLVFILIGVPIIAFFMALAFLKVNNKPFIYAVESALQYITSPRFYKWKKEDKKIQEKDLIQTTNKAQSEVYIPKLSENKLRELTWGLDIHESLSKEDPDAELRNEFDFKI